MLKSVVFFFLASSYALENNTCYHDLNCIPLSECEEIKNFINFDNYTNYARSFSCGYFHEPYVCCNRNCVTPNGGFGRAVLLEDCPNLEQNTLPHNKNKAKFLKDSFLNETHVCCNKNENEYKTVLPAPIDEPTENSVSCITPNGEKAKCSHISSCPAYIKVASKTNQYFGFINDSFCGYWDSPMVCCGSVSSYKENYVSNLPHENVCGIWHPSTNEDIPPWVGMIEVSNSREICVGALINYQYVISTSICTGRVAKRLNVKFGECITYDSKKSECHFKVKQVKLFPLHNYLHSGDTGIVLLKLARTTTKFNRIPICLPQDQLAVRQRVNLVGLERSTYSEWTGNDISGSALFNDDCNFEADLKYLCFKSENIHFVPYQYILAKVDDNHWYLEGIFNWKEWNGSPSRNMYAIYVYKFASWIKSNIS